MILAAEGELNPLVPHPVEIVVGTIAFLLLFWLLAKTVFPQFEKVYAERTDPIEGGLKRAEEAQEQAAALKRQYEEQLAGLRAEAARIRDDARAEGNRIRAELREQAERGGRAGSAARRGAAGRAARAGRAASSGARSATLSVSWPNASSAAPWPTRTPAGAHRRLVPRRSRGREPEQARGPAASWGSPPAGRPDGARAPGG